MVEYQTNTAQAVKGGDLNFIFWGKDTHSSYLMGEESLTGGGGDLVKVADGSNTSIAHLGGVSILYTDLDDTAEWHISVVNFDAVSTLTAGVATLWFNFVPEYPA